jgi:hypothetical protein
MRKGVTRGKGEPLPKVINEKAVTPTGIGR